MSRTNRPHLVLGIATVALWVVGMILHFASGPPDKATDAQILAWVDHRSDRILLGCWLFGIGCLGFVWVAALLRRRLVELGAETGASLVFGSAVASAVFGIASVGGDLAAAVNKNDISATTAGALTQFNDAFFLGVQLAAAALAGGFAVVAWRTRGFPRVWAVLSGLLAVVLLIGPTGWLGVVFGLPIWTLGTTALLASPQGRKHARAAAPVTA